MARISTIDRLVPNDVIALINPGETFVGKLINIEFDVITLLKPHIMIMQPGPSGVRLQFIDYSEGSFVKKRDQRKFDAANFVTVDTLSPEVAEHFKSMLSGIKTPPKSKLII